MVEGSKEYNGCLPNFTLSPWGYQAFVPHEKWLKPSPVITKFVPGHDRRLSTDQNTINVPVQLHFSEIMDCQGILHALKIKSTTEDGSQATIDPGSANCSNIFAFDSDVSLLIGKPTGEIPSVFAFNVNLIGVSHGLHSVAVANVSTKEGRAFTNVCRE